MKINKNKIIEKISEGALFISASLSIFVTIGIILVLLFETIEFFKEVPIIKFLTEKQWTPLFEDKHFGILPLLNATILTSLIAMVVAISFGLTIAVYISEYIKPEQRMIIKPIMEILAVVPTVVYGYFALLFVTPLLRKIFPDISTFNALSPGIVMGFMIIPIIATLSDDAMQAVPKWLREGGYALGANKFQVTTGVVIPSALSGIMASFILGVSRAIGETMIVTIAAGQMPNLTFNVLEPMETITAYIVQVSLGDTPAGTLEFKTIFAAGMTLFILTFILNIISYFLKNKYRERYR
ncbi:MAG: phosphate ABC transporter permease subunit PstC [Candidatus Goldbacteria bacterium]|nr:phosphate ABC transporter permease subunit PstC [Candidatus Goldiibacteriota bacterium]